LKFNILNEAGDFRSIFWANPFNFGLSVPFGKGITFSVGNRERINQSFDVFLSADELTMHAIGKGGIGEIFAGLDKDLGFGEIALNGSYLFGNSWEIWDYNISNYFQTDTFFYKYHGQIFSAGLELKPFLLCFEGFGSLIMENSDTTIDLPERLSIGLRPRYFGGNVDLLYEHSFWQKNDYRSPNRFKIGFTKGKFRFDYFYNPWYLKYVNEHGLDFSWKILMKNLGSINININCCLRNKDSLREFKIIPAVTFTFNEIFARRR